MRHLFSRLSNAEHGQSAIIIAGALVVLVAAIALVVDGGNAYAQRRQLQNALDAGAQAGAIQMSLHKKNGEIDSAIADYVGRNGVDANPTNVKAFFVTVDQYGTKRVEYGPSHNWTIHDYYASSSYPPTSINGQTVYGLSVEGAKQFPTYFAGVVGWRQMRVGTDAFRPAGGGTCHADDLFPITISANTFLDENNDGSVDFHFTSDQPTYTYKIFEKKTTELKNFGYVTWNGTNTTTQLANYMTGYASDPKLSGGWSKGDNIPYATGDVSKSQILNALQPFVNMPVTVPVYDYANISGGSITSYRIVGFARMIIASISVKSAAQGGSYLSVKFDRFVEATGGPTGGAVCPFYGVPSIVPPGPVPTPGQVARSLIGTVKMNKLTPVTGFTQTTSHIPVEVTNVLDISGSMNDNFVSVSKLTAAKTALKNFNNNMQPALGDKVALATYPELASGTKYSYTCSSQQSTTYYNAKQLSSLTSNISGVNSIINSLSANGGTPIAAGMQQGRLTALGAGHTPGRPSIIILASDGLANILLNGKATGFVGDVYNSPACNTPAVQDALDQANLAKADANHDGQPDAIIFTIAVGDDFNPDLMRAIASVDTDPSKPHYFRVTDPASMNSIYQQIANRVQNIQNESCAPPIQSEAFSSTTAMVIRNKTTGQSYNVTTTFTGEFAITNIAPGTYEVTSATTTVNGFTYNVLTNGLGGPALTSNPTIVVGQQQGQYKLDLFLKTNDTISCAGG